MPTRRFSRAEIRAFQLEVARGSRPSAVAGATASAPTRRILGGARPASSSQRTVMADAMAARTELHSRAAAPDVLNVLEPPTGDLRPPP